MAESNSGQGAAKSRGEVLKRLRDEKGLSLKPAAEMGGVSRSTIQNLEAGYTLDPGISNIAMIRSVYGLSTVRVLELFDISISTEIEETEVRLETVEEAATGVLVAVWKAIQNGILDERSVIADQALRLRDALNPDWPNNPGWLPPELQENS